MRACGQLQPDRGMTAMHNVRNRMANRGRKGAPIRLPDRSATRSAAEPAGTLPPSPPANGALPANAAPFLLQHSGPRFPEDVLIPRSRGATITATPLPVTPPQPAPTDEALLDPTAEPDHRPARRQAAKAAKVAGKAAGTPARKAPKSRTGTKPGIREKPKKLTSRAASAKPRKVAPAIMSPPAVPTARPASVAPLSAPVTHQGPSVAIPLAERTIPLARSQSLVAPGRSVVARIVGWLTKLAPRQKRSALPKARKTLRAAPAVQIPVPTDDALTRRMMLELSEENARLRRELDALRLSSST